MKLISCDSCGVLLDADKLPFPEDITDSEGGVDETKALWDGDDWVAKVDCPVCKASVAKSF